MLSGRANLTLIIRKILVFLFLPGPPEFFQTSVLLLFVFNMKQFKDNTYIRYHCDKCMCYKKWQCLRGSVLKTILHEGKAIFSTKQTNITKQVQWYFYILEILKKKKRRTTWTINTRSIQTYRKFKSYIRITQIYTEEQT